MGKREGKKTGERNGNNFFLKAIGNLRPISVPVPQPVV